ncbi:hypothetical protein COLSTE_01177 [Collinsella stercoris DSM 13279]|uniref:Uncharacterized protein n=1 Tax=Collinsella stercoris DSM 13279 TaxID=445975 RepID=B6GAS7_9ACTN|nr:hypothetical protein COLSTE_01177 [Collinsella stercoris DSM 13279]
MHVRFHACFHAHPVYLGSTRRAHRPSADNLLKRRRCALPR